MHFAAGPLRRPPSPGAASSADAAAARRPQLIGPVRRGGEARSPRGGEAVPACSLDELMVAEERAGAWERRPRAGALGIGDDRDPARSLDDRVLDLVEALQTLTAARRF